MYIKHGGEDGKCIHNNNKRTLMEEKTLAAALNPGMFSQYKTSDARCTLQTNNAMGRGSLLNIQSPKFLKCILRKTSCMKGMDKYCR